MKTHDDETQNTQEVVEVVGERSVWTSLLKPLSPGDPDPDKR